MTWKEAVSLSDPGLLFIPNRDRCNIGSDCQPQRKAKPSGKASGRPHSFPARGIRLHGGGGWAARGCCFPAPLRSFPSVTHPLTSLIPLHCSPAGAAPVLHREAGGMAVTSQPASGASSCDGNRGASNSNHTLPRRAAP